MRPPFTPKQALEYGDGVLDGYTITLDGPQGCPSDILAPYVQDPDGVMYAPDGDEFEPVTETSVWVRQEWF